ncbi:MAG TPA: hypothetical protein VM657_14760 [Sphingomonas sp.]|nr:hypothetical protein [Sphingomonas sp.]
MILPLFITLAVASAPQQCREIHYAADGSVTDRMVDADTAENAAAASAHSEGAGRAHSSVSASSHSGGGHAHASSSVDGRRVTMERGPDGCTITIDERAPQQRNEQ